jgi:hypothetical protein
MSNGVPAVVSFKFRKVEFIEPQYTNMVKGPTGTVARWLRGRAREAVFQARIQVGKDTGRLAKSIKFSMRAYRSGQEVSIFSNNKIAYMHHEGTRPHLIFSKKAGNNLVFFGSKTKSIVFTPMVRHPGTKPNRYLSDQLKIFTRDLTPL